LPGVEPCAGIHAVDPALDVEDGIDPTHGFECDGRYVMRDLPLAGTPLKYTSAEGRLAAEL
jgi:hypothetical protein